MSTKIYRIKMNDVCIHLAIVLITHVKKKKKSNMPKNKKRPSIKKQVQFQKSQKVLPFHLTDVGHFNSYSFKFNSGT